MSTTQLLARKAWPSPPSPAFHMQLSESLSSGAASHRDSLSPLLDVVGLETHFHTRNGTVRAVDGMSFSIRRGESLAIVGESGSGKSVTARSIMRLLREPMGSIVGGKILLAGQDLATASEAQMGQIRGRRIAMIFQDPMTSLNPVLTIGRQLIEVMQLHLKLSHREACARAAELLETVGIPSPGQRLNDYPHQFSGGMRQRVMIAMALACDPELLIADEPTTALDVTIQAQILELIRRIQRERSMSLLIITHDLGVVAGVADQVAIVYGGKVVETASVDSIFARPRMPYTIGLLRSIPHLGERRSRLTSIPGRPPMLTEAATDCRFSARCRHVQPLCRTQVPVLREVEPSHHAACH